MPRSRRHPDGPSRVGPNPATCDRPAGRFRGLDSLAVWDGPFHSAAVGRPNLRLARPCRQAWRRPFRGPGQDHAARRMAGHQSPHAIRRLHGSTWLRPRAYATVRHDSGTALSRRSKRMRTRESRSKPRRATFRLSSESFLSARARCFWTTRSGPNGFRQPSSSLRVDRTTTTRLWQQRKQEEFGLRGLATRTNETPCGSRGAARRAGRLPSASRLRIIRTTFGQRLPRTAMDESSSSGPASPPAANGGFSLVRSSPAIFPRWRRSRLLRTSITELWRTRTARSTWFGKASGTAWRRSSDQETEDFVKARAPSRKPAKPFCSKRPTQYSTDRGASPSSLATCGQVIPWATSSTPSWRRWS